MNTQPSDTSTKRGAAKLIAAGIFVIVLMAGGTVFLLNNKQAPGSAVTEAKKAFNSFVIVTGPTLEDTVRLTLARPSGEEIEIEENLTLDTSRRIFSHEENEGNDYTLTTEILNKKGDARTLSMALHSVPTMIVITLSGFTPEEGLDLYVGKNSISTRLPVDWGGNLQQTIPLPIEPQGPFCLVVTDSAKKETVRVCHELPPRKREGLLG